MNPARTSITLVSGLAQIAGVAPPLYAGIDVAERVDGQGRSPGAAVVAGGRFGADLTPADGCVMPCRLAVPLQAE